MSAPHETRPAAPTERQWSPGTMLPEYPSDDPGDPVRAETSHPDVILETHRCRTQRVSFWGWRALYSCTVAWGDGAVCGATWYDRPPLDNIAMRTWRRPAGGEK